MRDDGDAREGEEPAVRVRGLTRRFGSTVALSDARLEALPGQVLGVLGENGAGKTTLLSILAGLLSPDAGTVEIRGREVTIPSPRRARELGIGMVHQHFALVPRLTVLENLMLGWPGRLLALPESEVRSRAGELAGETGLTLPLDVPVEALGVGERQRVEIFKVLLQDPDILILDEPTAVLAPAEVEGLLGLIRSLADGGTAILLVAHKLDEVLAVADRVTVLRRGETVLEAPRDEVDAARLARCMVGRESAEGLVHVTEAPAAGAEPREAGPVVAALEAVTVEGNRGQARLDGVSLEVHAGEIVGVAGVEGNGQRELAQLLAGVRDPDAGVRRIPQDPAFIPQDRRREGLVQEFDLVENLALRLRQDAGFRRGPFLDWAALGRRADRAIDEFSVRTAGPRSPVASLSGGNQQRIVLARELDGEPEFLVAENPTRGLDLAGAAFVHQALRRLRDRESSPAGIVLVSTDLDEILALSDRFFVMVRGRLQPVETGPNLRERLGERMLGAADP